MIPKTPSGFRDCLPTEAAWRLSLKEKINESFRLWGYLPVETPALELVDVLEMDGKLASSPFEFFDGDGQLLVMRPDVTLPVARMSALRLNAQEGPLRLCYAQPVFMGGDGAYGQSRQVTQAGIEFIGRGGALADAEVIVLLFETLAAAGLEDFTVAIGTVAVLNALVNEASDDASWRADVFAAFHRSDLVAVDRLADDERAKPVYAEAIGKLSRVRGGAEAIQACRDIVRPLGCEDGLDSLERSFELACKNIPTGRLMVDFSVISSFDYYTGMVFKAFAPQVSSAIASGGRYDRTLASFGCDRPAAGFAVSLEQLMQALSAEGARPPAVGPERELAALPAEELFAKARELRRTGVSVAIGEELR